MTQTALSANPPPTCINNTDCASRVVVVPGRPVTATLYKLGVYTIRYSSSSNPFTSPAPDTCYFDNEALPSPTRTLANNCTRILRMFDTLPPAMTLSGASSIILEGGKPWADPGATGLDIINGAMAWGNRTCTLNQTMQDRGLIEVLAPIGEVRVPAHGQLQDDDATLTPILNLNSPYSASVCVRA